MTLNDRTKITELWGLMDKMWWEDANDPSIRLLTVTPDRGEIWDSPNRLGFGSENAEGLGHWRRPRTGRQCVRADVMALRRQRGPDRDQIGVEATFFA